MTNRVSELRTGPTAKRADFAVGAGGDAADQTVARHGIPLDLVPLVSPYKGKGRLTLRIERMPRAARLSAGRNNGDNSWSLTLDELEGLEYLLPEGSHPAHTLALRVISRDDVGASTLVVFDLPISPNTVGSQPAAAQRAVPAVVASVGDKMQLRDELAKAVAALAARESELSEARRRSERAEAEIALKAGALAEARATWKADTDARIAAIAAKAVSDLEHGRNAWQAEENARIDELEARAQTRMAQARESWRREMQDALSQAESLWQRGEADRLAALEKQWQAQANKAIAEARAEMDTQRNESGTELRRLRNDLARTRATVAERDAELTRSRAASEAAHQAEQQPLDAATVPGTGDAELRQVRDALIATQATLAEREQDLAKARADIETIQRIQQQTGVAEATWRADEAERLAAAERRWQGEYGKHLAEAKARYEAAELALADMDRRTRQEGAATNKLRNELAMLQSILDSRDIELSRMHATFAPDLHVTSDPIAARRRAAAEASQAIAQSRRDLIRDVVVVMGLVMALALIYFRFEPVLSGYLRAVLPTMVVADSGPVAGSVAPEKLAPATASAVERDTAIVTRGVNLRAGPSTAASTIATLPRGIEVETIEQRGNWTRVKLRDQHDPSKPQEGWIYNSYIKAAGAPPENSAVANRSPEHSH